MGQFVLTTLAAFVRALKANKANKRARRNLVIFELMIE